MSPKIKKSEIKIFTYNVTAEDYMRTVSYSACDTSNSWSIRTNTIYMFNDRDVKHLLKSVGKAIFSNFLSKIKYDPFKKLPTADIKIESKVLKLKKLEVVLGLRENEDSTIYVPLKNTRALNLEEITKISEAFKEAFEEKQDYRQLLGLTQ